MADLRRCREPHCLTGSVALQHHMRLAPQRRTPIWPARMRELRPVSDAKRGLRSSGNSAPRRRRRDRRGRTACRRCAARCSRGISPSSTAGACARRRRRSRQRRCGRSRPVSSNFFSVPRTTMPSRGLRGAQQVHGGDAAGIEPVAGEIERRAIAVLQPQHVAVEVLGALQVGRFDGVVLQAAKRHGRSP